MMPADLAIMSYTCLNLLCHVCLELCALMATRDGSDRWVHAAILTPAIPTPIILTPLRHSLEGNERREISKD